MSQHTPNELTKIFARDRKIITRLKDKDAHYARLAEEYHDVNREVHRIEAETEELAPVPDSMNVLMGCSKGQKNSADVPLAVIKALRNLTSPLLPNTSKICRPIRKCSTPS